MTEYSHLTENHAMFGPHNALSATQQELACELHCRVFLPA